MTDKHQLKAFFSQNIKENIDSLYSVALRLTKNRADAEDLVAESVAKAWAAIGNLDDQSRFRSWMFRILHNCFISDYRKKNIRPVESSYDDLTDENNGGDVASLLIEQPNEFLSWWANPEKEVFNNFLGEEIIQAIETLPEAFQVTVSLVNLEGFTYDEAAEVLGVSPGTIRSRMNRGRTLLQKALWQHAQDAGLISDVAMTECN